MSFFGRRFFLELSGEEAQIAKDIRTAQARIRGTRREERTLPPGRSHPESGFFGCG